MSRWIGLLLILAACSPASPLLPHLTPLDFEPAQGWKKSIDGPQTLRYLQVKPQLRRAQVVLQSGDYEKRHRGNNPLSPIDNSFLYRLQKMNKNEIRFYWVSFTQWVGKKQRDQSQKALKCKPLSNREIAFQLYQAQERPFRMEAVEQLFYILADEMLRQGHKASYPQIYSPILAKETGQVQASERGLLGMNLTKSLNRRAGFWVCPKQ